MPANRSPHKTRALCCREITRGLARRGNTKRRFFARHPFPDPNDSDHRSEARARLGQGNTEAERGSRSGSGALAHIRQQAVGAGGTFASRSTRMRSLSESSSRFRPICDYPKELKSSQSTSGWSIRTVTIRDYKCAILLSANLPLRYANVQSTFGGSPRKQSERTPGFSGPGFLSFRSY